MLTIGHLPARPVTQQHSAPAPIRLQRRVSAAQAAPSDSQSASRPQHLWQPALAWTLAACTALSCLHAAPVRADASTDAGAGNVVRSSSGQTPAAAVAEQSPHCECAGCRDERDRG